MDLVNTQNPFVLEVCLVHDKWTPKITDHQDSRIQASQLPCAVDTGFSQLGGVVAFRVWLVDERRRGR
jgi:hypothetical protein